MKIIRETWEQYYIKNDMGLFDGVEIKTRFHWKFWKSVECRWGEKVYFGRYVEYQEPERDK